MPSVETREDPYYQPQDPMWPAFEAFLFDYLNWRAGWNFSESRGVWWKYWLAFKAGVEAENKRALELT